MNPQKGTHFSLTFPAEKLIIPSLNRQVQQCIILKSVSESLQAGRAIKINLTLPSKFQCQNSNIKFEAVSFHKHTQSMILCSLESSRPGDRLICTCGWLTSCKVLFYMLRNYILTDRNSTNWADTSSYIETQRHSKVSRNEKSQ